MPERSTVTALPKLPGFSFEEKLTQPSTYGLTSSFAVDKGVHIVKQVDTSKPGSTAQKALSGKAAMFSDDAIFSRHPQWKTLTNKVLRFFGYFTEEVTESAVEKVRVRRVTVLFYLADRTMTLNENPATGNHGMRAGCLMSRHPAAFGVEQLRIGEYFNFRAREVALVDCDEATRQFYQDMGLPQPGSMDFPPDAFEKTQNRTKAPMDQDHIEMKQSIEALAAATSGKHSTTLTPAERLKAKRFFSHDREVLNFSATWEQRKFRIMFFLADGTMQISQVKTNNDGRDPVAAFVRRGLIPKGNFKLKSIDTVSEARNETQACFTDLDLITGQTITLFDREFFIYDCDSFTKNYYQAVHNIDQAQVEKPWTEGDPPVNKNQRQMELPPYNGFGSEDDSLGSFKHMVPKPPKKDYGKYIKHANDVLRFSAELTYPKAEDAGRQFIVCFYLADDTVSIFEYAVRNSGHTGGKIFARAKVAGVVQSDFFVGAHLKLSGLDFNLTDVDDRTLNYLETGYSMGKLNDTKADELLAKLRKVLNQRFSRVTDAYRHFNRSKSGLGIEDLGRMLKECEVQVDSPELIAGVMQLVDLDQDGVISLQEFVENLLKQTLATPTASRTTPAMSAKSYAEAQEMKSKREFADKVHAMFVAKLEARRAFIVDTFRIVSDRSTDGLIGVETFKSVVQDRLGLNLTDAELDALVFKFFHVDQMENWMHRRLSLREFRKVLDA